MSLGNEVTWAFQLDKINNFFPLALLFFQYMTPPNSNVRLSYSLKHQGVLRKVGTERKAMKYWSFWQTESILFKKWILFQMYL
jgi:hypothetical protein